MTLGLDDFLWRALLAGIGLALVAGPLGVFVVWRRMAYFGDTLAHSSLLGVALGFLLGISPNIGVALVTFSVAGLLLLLQRRQRLATDTLLGILSHGALSLGLVAIAFLSDVRIDLLAYLFGDILSVDGRDLIAIWLGGGAVLAALARLWQPLLAVTVHEELARIEGVPVERARLVFLMMIALVIAVAMKVVGALLITALLIIPAATARRFSRTPEQMALLAAVFGMIAVGIGLALSWHWDTPAGPSVVVGTLILFTAQYLLPRRANA
ncbi:MAG: zinc ABC transporter permease subunit ZnuB [Gammaproteobacteria bacterium]